MSESYRFENERQKKITTMGLGRKISEMTKNGVIEKNESSSQ